MSLDEIIAVIDEADFNVTLTGGDPLFQAEGATELARRLKESGRSVWCYTGYRFEAVVADPRLSPMLRWIDVLVDGPFVERLRDIQLRFRGSSNQRLVDVVRSTPAEVVIWDN